MNPPARQPATVVALHLGGRALMQSRGWVAAQHRGGGSPGGDGDHHRRRPRDATARSTPHVIFVAGLGRPRNVRRDSRTARRIGTADRRTSTASRRCLLAGTTIAVGLLFVAFSPASIVRAHSGKCDDDAAGVWDNDVFPASQAGTNSDDDWQSRSVDPIIVTSYDIPSDIGTQTVTPFEGDGFLVIEDGVLHGGGKNFEVGGYEPDNPTAGYDITQFPIMCAAWWLPSRAPDDIHVNMLVRLGSMYATVEVTEPDTGTQRFRPVASWHEGTAGTLKRDQWTYTCIDLAQQYRDRWAEWQVSGTPSGEGVAPDPGTDASPNSITNTAVLFHVRNSGNVPAENRHTFAIDNFSIEGCGLPNAVSDSCSATMKWVESLGMFVDSVDPGNGARAVTISVDGVATTYYEIGTADELPDLADACVPVAPQ